MTPITVLLAEDHAIVREGLHALLKLEPDFKVIGEAENGRQAVLLANKHSPDVVVMDIAMPLLNGLEATRQILQHKPATKILILSAHSDDTYVNQVLALGAAGYLIKQTASDVLHEAIRQVHNGKPFFSPSISRRRLQHEIKLHARGDLPGKAARDLTTREMEVLQLVAEGKANKETAAELNISVKTVEKHRQSLMEKLNIHDTAGLTRYAISAGIIEGRVQATIV
jgi:DNA-binding NarL/FixJ family response regulator